MKKLILITMLLTGMLASGFLFAEGWNNQTPFMNMNSLLNPNNLRMNHTMSFMSGVSSTGKGFYQSSYTNHLFFDLTPNLDLNVDLSFVNYGSTTWDDTFSVRANDDNRSTVIPQFSLNYQPRENVHFRIEFKSGNSPYQRARSRWYD